MSRYGREQRRYNASANDRRLGVAEEKRILEMSRAIVEKNVPIPSGLNEEQQQQFDMSASEAWFEAINSSPDGAKLEKVVNKELTIMMLAAVFRAKNVCPHVWPPTPSRVFYNIMAPRILSCRECLVTFSDLVARNDLKKLMKQDMQCDLCLEQSVHFYRCTINAGILVLVGDFCDRCKDLISRK